jgi:hypothetical protein
MVCNCIPKLIAEKHAEVIAKTRLLISYLLRPLCQEQYEGRLVTHYCASILLKLSETRHGRTNVASASCDIFRRLIERIPYHNLKARKTICETVENLLLDGKTFRRYQKQDTNHSSFQNTSVQSSTRRVASPLLPQFYEQIMIRRAFRPSSVS